MTEEKVKKLFDNIIKSIEEEDNEQIIEICDKILSLEKENSIAKECKIVAQIHNGDYEDALSEMKKLGTKSAMAKSYCLFRLGKLEEAAKELTDDSKIETQQLLGQIHYKLQDSKSFKFYEKLSKEKMDDETKTNIIASFIENKKYSEAHKFKNENFETLYNIGCCFIGEKKYQEALEILKEAKLKCEENGKKDELEQDDIDYDMAIINVQIGFVLQMMGKKEEAKEYYTNLISSKIQDLSSRSIARNNLLVLRENKDLFDSLKQMKLANSTKSLATLNLNQQKLIQWNYCLLLMNMDSNKECSEILENLMKQYQQEESFIILHAALKSKEKKFEEATIILNEFLKKFPKSNDVKLFLSQMHLTKGNVEESLNILNSLENKFEPSIVSSIISLMNRLGQHENTISTLNEACKHWEQNKNEDKLKKLLLENAKLKMKNSLFKDASKDFEKLVQLDSSNQIFISGLVRCLSEFDIERAESMSKLLPSISTENVDVNKLESQNISDFMRSTNKSSDLDILEDSEKPMKKKRIKKKKPNRNSKLEEKFSKKKKKKVALNSKSAQGSQTKEDQSKFETKLGQKKIVDVSTLGKKKKTKLGK